MKKSSGLFRYSFFYGYVVCKLIFVKNNLKSVANVFFANKMPLILVYFAKTAYICHTERDLRASRIS